MPQKHLNEQDVKRIVEFDSRRPRKHGDWSGFCVEHGYTKDQVYHWRKKLGLVVARQKERGDWNPNGSEDPAAKPTAYWNRLAGLVS
jgi:hypothetical protein